MADVASAGEVQVRLRSLAQIIPDEKRKALLQRAAVHAVSLIKERTQRGIDADGGRFAPYSEGYDRLRAGSGRGTDVDLTLSGGMLASMTVLEVTAERALIGFMGSTTPYQFKRLRTKKGKATSRKTKAVTVTHTLSRKTQGAPVANALKAKALNDGTGRMKARHFFGLSPEEKRFVVDEAARTLKIRR